MVGRGDSFIVARLDRAVCNLYWRNLFLNSLISHLDYWRSDHMPILINIDDGHSSRMRPARGGRHFLFEECWSSDHACEQIVACAWSTSDFDAANPQGLVLRNLSSCPIQLQHWYC
ncbi:hypothetical protein ACOSP7_028511 [Xanthoceras sorbifolium]